MIFIRFSSLFLALIRKFLIRKSIAFRPEYITGIYLNPFCINNKTVSYLFHIKLNSAVNSEVYHNETLFPCRFATLMASRQL
jgi:hypothetical protein